MLLERSVYHTVAPIRYKGAENRTFGLDGGGRWTRGAMFAVCEKQNAGRGDRRLKPRLGACGHEAGLRRLESVNVVGQRR